MLATEDNNEPLNLPSVILTNCLQNYRFSLKLAEKVSETEAASLESIAQNRLEKDIPTNIGKPGGAVEAIAKVQNFPLKNTVQKKRKNSRFRLEKLGKQKLIKCIGSRLPILNEATTQNTSVVL